MRDPLRKVRLEGGYTLATYDTGRTDERGQTYIGYEFAGPDGVAIFDAEDFRAGACTAIDSDAALRGLLGFLTLRPGDTDEDYFAGYTPEQMAFAETEAEQLQIYTEDEDPVPFENLDGWEP